MSGRRQHFVKPAMICAGNTTKLAKQMDPRDVVMARKKARTIELEQHGLISSG
jgi:hypothetical protein